jgi:arginine/ornithine N-succinyltransferase beta subunit
VPLGARGTEAERLVAVERTTGPSRFRAVRCRARLVGDRVGLPGAARQALGVAPGDVVHLVPFD